MHNLALNNIVSTRGQEADSETPPVIGVPIDDKFRIFQPYSAIMINSIFLT